MQLTTFSVAALRAKEFPWTLSDKTLYLNNAGSGPLPQRSVDTLKAWADARAQPWHVTDHDVVFPALAQTRRRCAALIGARAEEIALVPNTSFGLNLAARCLPLTPGDEVLACDGEFPSVVYAWRAVEQSRGIRLRLIPSRDGLPDEDGLLAALDAPRVRVVTVSWVSFASGYRMDLERLGAACHARGIYLVVDAMQGLGPTTLDVKTGGPAIVACGGYKWLLSPWGAAFVYVRADLVATLDPPVVGWFVGPGSEDYTRLLSYDLTYFEDARRFEVMTLPAQDLIAMGESIGLLLEIGPQAVEAHVRALTDHIVDDVLHRPHLRLVTPMDARQRAGIVSIGTPDPVRTSRRLLEAGVRHSLRERAIRLSPYIYTTIDETDIALKVLAQEL